MNDFFSELKDYARTSVIVGVGGAITLYVTWLCWGLFVSFHDPRPQQVESKAPPATTGSIKPSIKPSPKKESQKPQ